MPAGAAQLITANNLRRVRLKESFTLLVQHIVHEDTRTILGDPDSTFFARGDLAYAWVMTRIIVVTEPGDVEDMRVDWHLTEIVTDIGVDDDLCLHTRVNDVLRR